jgi:transposase-like protein
MNNRGYPPQIVLGGLLGKKVWHEVILPILQEGMPTREAAERLGVSHMTVARWRRDYL